MTTKYLYGFRVLGDCRQPRRLVDWSAAFAAYAACDARAECGREAYLSAFTFADDFRAHLTATGSTAGYARASWAPWIWFDVDREGDLPAALDDTRRLCAVLTDQLGVNDDDTLAFLSGGKGFHLGIPSALWAPAPGPDFHKIARRFAEGVAELAGVAIDTGVYDRVRCFRAPNSRHPKTGLHKRHLTVDELMNLGAGAILALAEAPAEFELPQPTYQSKAALALWAKATTEVHQQAEANAARRVNVDQPGRLNRSTLTFIRDGAGIGDRHRLLYSAAANLAELGASLPLCFALLEESALDAGLTPTDTRRAIENGWASVQSGVATTCTTFTGEVVGVGGGS